MIQHGLHPGRSADFWLQAQDNIFLLVQSKYLARETKSRGFESRSGQAFFFFWQRRRESKTVSDGGGRPRRWERSWGVTGRGKSRRQRRSGRVLAVRVNFLHPPPGSAKLDWPPGLTARGAEPCQKHHNGLTAWVYYKTDKAYKHWKGKRHVYKRLLCPRDLLDWLSMLTTCWEAEPCQKHPQAMTFTDWVYRKINRHRRNRRCEEEEEEKKNKEKKNEEAKNEEKKNEEKKKMKMTIIWMRWMRLPDLRIFKSDENVNFKIAN